MNQRVLKFSAAVVFLFTSSGFLFAQNQEQIDRLNEERKAYFNEKLELTAAEIKAFWPLYDDFQNRKMKLVEDERNTYQYAFKNADHLSEAEILENLEKVYTLKDKQIELESEYYQDKFLKALPAKKVLMLGKVEWDFRRYLLQQLRDREGGHRGQGGGAGNNPEITEHSWQEPAPLQTPAPF
jgi:hypothetical protein